MKSHHNLQAFLKSKSKLKSKIEDLKSLEYGESIDSMFKEQLAINLKAKILIPKNQHLIAK